MGGVEGDLGVNIFWNFLYHFIKEKSIKFN